jgi:hypothetical protein
VNIIAAGASAQACSKTGEKDIAVAPKISARMVPTGTASVKYIDLNETIYKRE